jgi:hypothetical protein
MHEEADIVCLENELQEADITINKVKEWMSECEATI